jgi:hypothetical protein
LAISSASEPDVLLSSAVAELLVHDNVRKAAAVILNIILFMMIAYNLAVKDQG